MSRLIIKERMLRSIAKRKGEVVLRGDFEKMGSPSQVSRALNELIKAGRLVRIGYGVYAKARVSSVSGKPVPREPLEVLAWEALVRLKVDVRTGRAQTAYAEGKTGQIPMQATFSTGNRRISRKLSVGNRSVRYENNYSARTKRDNRPHG
ncbi:DUF6088 family protein [Desulfobulbus alkaliphilus]|uniref:DUF6088 family protein n=1 Tax=Desulfobulbus alkaliphilus TaxID=869814 RepID=UPI00196441D4|nr:DUF6088 family protein [Desulfobulbus alkaliphilus]MBM9535466.1 type IV toxin-antitoxin system AbiEi family antitoxin domain-containing protein [Desulfobulbus alkaliphilus]